MVAQDLGNEAKMFALLDSLPGLSIVSVGHRPSLVPYHDTKLILTSKGYSVESTGSDRKNRGRLGSVPGSTVSGVAEPVKTGR